MSELARESSALSGTEAGTRAAPSSTYRLQIRASFDLVEAAAVTPYLRELGVGAVYLSPLLEAVAGSEHGYDVADHRRIDPARGGAQGLARLLDAARENELAVVVDLVPNHAGVADAAQNPAWWDLLQYGRDSRYADWFDVEWKRLPLLLPVLGDDADRATDLTLERSAATESGWELRYYEHRLPVASGTATEGDTAGAVHDRQFYRLVGYRVADEEQNYRRFFAVTDLAGLRVEDPAVFEATHCTLLRYVDDGSVTGLRIDHPDGLVDPGQYLERLRAAAPSAWITVEKILEPGEELPEVWPVEDTTGYDALGEVNAVMTDPAGAEALTALYRRVTGDERDWAQHVADGKGLIVTTILHAEIRRLVRLVPEVDAAEAALTELVVAFPVYRSYLPLDVERFEEAVGIAERRRPDLGPVINALRPRLTDPDDELARRFQQVTGAVMAKGVEDTAYYRYSRAVWLNEVGGDPGTVGCGLDAFHAAQQRRQHYLPMSMTTLSTHDTKRGEDVRARLAALSELTGDWAHTALTLASMRPLPNQAFGLLLWQSFLGAGFVERDRMHAYAGKAMREAADGTGWRDPDAAFETCVHEAVDAAYDNAEVHNVLALLGERLTAPGWSNSLSQKLIALSMPGVPDVYQGTELWEDSLVDPDNRRPVDYAARRTLLADLDAANTPPPVGASGAAKLWLVSRVLRARRDRPELFTGYRPLYATGAVTDHLIAYDRGGAVALATRLPVGLARRGGWQDSSLVLPDGTYVDALTGRDYSGAVAVADVLSVYPAALLLARNNPAPGTT